MMPSAFRSEKRNQTTPESGFTLVELLITVTLMGVITAAITMAFFTGLKAADAGSRQLPGPQQAQNLNSWLSADIESADPATITFVNVASDCSPAPETGTVVNVVHFEAADPASATRYAVSYRYRESGAEKSLWRTFCVKNQPPSHHAEIVASLDALPTPTLSATKKTLSIAMSVKTKVSNYQFALTGSVRTPKDHPPPPGPIIPGGPAAKDPCEFTANNAPSVNRAGAGTKEPLNGVVNFSVTTNLNTGTGSTCEDLWVRVYCSSGDCGNAGSNVAYLRLTQQLGPNKHIWAGSFTCLNPTPTPANLRLLCDEQWKAGTYPIEVNDGYALPLLPGGDPDSLGSPLARNPAVPRFQLVVTP